MNADAVARDELQTHVLANAMLFAREQQASHCVFCLYRVLRGLLQH